MTEFKRKSNRIKGFEYSGNYAYFVTICTKNKQPYFADQDLVERIILTMKSEAVTELFSIYAYCFMPDHLHLLLVGEEKSSLLKFIKRLKQLTGYSFRQKTSKILWQKSFYDHVLRGEEDIDEIAAYIFLNPVRKKLVEDFRQYKNLGSCVIDINEFYDSFGLRRNLRPSFLLRS